ncbi:MAG TPA: hypothetical protein VID03_00045 [Acidimicrobiia bacterium]|jgi:hypothetical protein
MSDDLLSALQRAISRAIYHLGKAGVEGLRAIEAIVDELGGIGSSDDEADDEEGPVHIEVE